MKQNKMPERGKGESYAANVTGNNNINTEKKSDDNNAGWNKEAAEESGRIDSQGFNSTEPDKTSLNTNS